MSVTVVTSENRAEFMAQRLGMASPAANDPPQEQQTEAAPTESAQVSGNDGTSSEDGKPNGIEKRFSELTRQREDANRRAEQLQRENEELKQRLQGASNQSEQQGSPQKLEKPDPAKFTDAFAYAEALAGYEANRIVQEREAQRDADAQRQKVAGDWEGRITQARKDMPDFDEVVLGADTQVSDAVRDAILESEAGPQLLYHLSKNPDVAEKISKLSGSRALIELGKLEAQLAKQPEAQTAAAQPTVATSKAQPPITPLKGTSAMVGDNLVDAKGNFTGSPDDYRRMREAGKIK